MDDAYYDDYFTHIIASLKPFKTASIQNIYIHKRNKNNLETTDQSQLQALNYQLCIYFK